MNDLIVARTNEKIAQFILRQCLYHGMQTIDFQQILASPVLTYEEGLNFFAGKGMLNETLRKLVEDLESYVPKFEGARKTFRSTARNVPIEIITAGEYPGDGKPKPVQFPDPKDAFTIINGVKTISLELLITLKLASGMTNAGRLKDLADVQELIKVRSLDASFAEKLDPFVREKFIELYQGAMQSNDAEE